MKQGVEILEDCLGRAGGAVTRSLQTKTSVSGFDLLSRLLDRLSRGLEIVAGILFGATPSIAAGSHGAGQQDRCEQEEQATGLGHRSGPFVIDMRYNNPRPAPRLPERRTDCGARGRQATVPRPMWPK